jgi:hypothetical protein
MHSSLARVFADRGYAGQKLEAAIASIKRMPRRFAKIEL